MSGLPEDSRDEDERAEARRLRDLHEWVKAARAVVAKTPGLVDILERDWREAAEFYARFGINEVAFRHGVSSSECSLLAGRLDESSESKLGV